MSTTAADLLDLFAGRAKQGRPPLYGAAQAGRPPLISFSYGLADPALFPTEEIVAATDAVLREDADAALNYGPSYRGLTQQIVGRLHAQGVEADEDQIIVTYGSSQVLGLLPLLFVDPGDTVIVEGPTFLGAVGQFSRAGARLVSVPTDADGLDVDALEQALRDLKRQNVRPKFIYTIPTFHNPTGATLTLERRQRLVSLAAEYGVVVVEDDAYSDLRFSGEPLPNLAALDDAGWVMRVSTYSKILAPGVRVGWAYGNREIIDRLAMLRPEGGSGPFMTRVVARFSEGGRLEAHIKKLNDLYRHKRDVMLSAIAREFPADVTALRPEGGFFVWCSLPPDISATKLLPLAEERGATFLPGTRCFANGQGDDAIRLAFSFLSADKIEEGVRLIGQAMRDLREQV
jgi:2-aminoadipate transaminase